MVKISKISKISIIGLYFSDYNWKELFENIDSREYEQEVDQIFYSDLINLRAVSGFGKLKSKHLGLQCRSQNLILIGMRILY